MRIMRTYLLAKEERKIIQAYLNDDIKLDGYQVLKTRTNKFNSSKIHDDLTLIQKFREKANSEKKSN